MKVKTNPYWTHVHELILGTKGERFAEHIFVLTLTVQFKQSKFSLMRNDTNEKKI